MHIFHINHTAPLFVGSNTVLSNRIPDEVGEWTHSVQFKSYDMNFEGYLEILQGVIKYNRTFPEDEFEVEDIYCQLYGAYFSHDHHIELYKMPPEYEAIVQIHENFHAIHHLTPDSNNSEWVEFAKVASFYKELLAQLCTYKKIENDTILRDAFLELNKNQSFIYQTWKIFRHFSQDEVNALYWAIRESTHPSRNQSKQLCPEIERALDVLNKLLIKVNSKCCTQISYPAIDEAVFEGIRKTINRFRERPYEFFTEADLHSSLVKDIQSGSSNALLRELEESPRITISLLHQEYPTNFRYNKQQLVPNKMPTVPVTWQMPNINTLAAHLRSNQNIGSRGHYDITVIHPEFVNETLWNPKDIIDKLEVLINKDIATSQGRDYKCDLYYVIEVKFFHLFNIANSNMIEEVMADTAKLMLTQKFYDPKVVRPIQIIFCASDDKSAKKSNPSGQSGLSSQMVAHFSNTGNKCGILQIFVEAFIDKGSNKKAKAKKIIHSNNYPQWAKPMIDKL